MKQIKNILVSLDLTDIDRKLIEYSAIIAERFNAENVYFAHNIKKFQLSDFFKEQMKDVDIESVVERRIEREVEQSFSAEANTEILISEDSDTVGLLQYVARKFAIDVMILGNKNYKDGTGVVSAKLLHSLTCDIISVNQEAQLPTGRFLCTTDFSKNSAVAVRLCRDVAQAFGASQTPCLNVYKIPQLFFPYLEKKEAIEEIEKQSKTRFKKFLKNHKLESDITPIVASAGAESIAKKIKNIARRENAELLFISGKGQNSFNTFLVGSITESLFTSKTHIPLWIVR